MKEIQKKVISMERAQSQPVPRTSPPKVNWQRKAPNHELRPPFQLEAANMAEPYTPFCRECEDFHKESSCYHACYVQEHGFSEGCSPKASSSETEYINYVGDMHNIFRESWRETKQYSREPDYINTVGQLHPVTTESWSQTREYSQEHDTSDEESLSSDMDDNYETILEVLCNGNPPCSPPHDEYLESWDPYDIFETQRLKRIFTIIRRMKIARDLVPVINTLSYLT